MGRKLSFNFEDVCFFVWIVSCLMIMVIDTIVWHEHKDIKRRIEVLEARPYIEKVQAPEGTTVVFKNPEKENQDETR